MKKKVIITIAVLATAVQLVKAQSSPKKYAELLVINSELGNKEKAFEVKIKADVSFKKNEKDRSDSVTFSNVEKFTKLSHALTYLAELNWEIKTIGFTGNTTRVILYKRVRR